MSSSPERNLIAEIIHQAIDDIKNGPKSKDLEVKEGGEDALEWILDMDPAFVAYCVAIDLDPGRVRDGIVARYT